jgi:hypothetical protein
MLSRRNFLIGMTTGAVLAGPAWARDFASQVEDRLKRQGYTIDSVGRTLLGRVRIVAHNASGQREIILNPRTGEILRDLWIVRADSDTSGTLGTGGEGNDGSGGGGDDRGDDDNSGSGGDDGEDDDNSGHGSDDSDSDSSGSGSSDDDGSDDD